MEGLNYSNLCSKSKQTIDCYDDMLAGCTTSDLRSMGLLEAYNDMMEEYNNGC